MDCGGLFLLHVCCTERNVARSSGSLEPGALDDFIASVWAKFSASDRDTGRSRPASVGSWP